MTSKNSFLANIRENLKRRNWVCAVFILAFFAYFVTVSLMFLNLAGEEYMHNTAKSLFITIVDVNPVTILLFGILAFLAAAHGFSYLHNREKIDMYHALPISRQKRFASIYINGILLFVLPYIISQVFVFLAFAVTLHTSSAFAIGTAVLAFFKNLLFYLCIYNASILACVMTGTGIMTFFATIFIAFYQNIILVLFWVFTNSFFDTAYSSSGHWTKMCFGIFEPVTTFIMTFAVPERNLEYVSPFALFYLLAFVIITGAAGFLLYLKRQDDCALNAISFKKVRPVISFLIVVPASLIISLIFFAASNTSAAFTFLGLLIGVVLMHGIIEAVFQGELRAGLLRKKTFAASAVCSFVIITCFVFDLFGYDSYRPSAEKLEGISVALDYSGRDDWHNFPVDDTQTALALAMNAVEEPNENAHLRFPVTYHLKNGRTVQRAYYIDPASNEALLSKLFVDKGYRRSFHVIFDENFAALYPNAKAHYSTFTGNRENPIPDTTAFRNAYLKDYETLTYEQYCTLTQLSRIRFTGGIPYSYWSVLPLFDTFTNTLAYFESAGLEVPAAITLEDTVSISIDSYENRDVSYTYNKPEEIKALLDSVALDDNYRPGAPGCLRFSYEITVQLSNGNQYVGQLCFKDENSIPDFIRDVLFN